MRIFSKLSDKFNTIVKKYKRATPKQLVMTGVFMLALASAIGAGFAAKTTSSAAVYYGQDCSPNSIDYEKLNGNCGAQTAKELIADIKDNKPADLAAVYNSFGLTPDKYDHFVKNAKEGIAYKDGTVRLLDGTVVMTNAWSIGRQKISSQSKDHWINGIRYYATNHAGTNILASDLPVFVVFNDNGEAEYFIIKACGNPGKGTPIKSSAECKGLNDHKVKKNVYRFSANPATVSGNAKVKGYRYYKNGVMFDETKKASDKTKEVTISGKTTIEVRVVISLPNGQDKEVSAGGCKKVIEEEKEEKFVYVCKDLYFTTKDNMTFRFFVAPEVSANVKAVSADFMLDGASMAKGVKSKNDKGEFYTEYTFKDEKSHTVTAVINVEYTKDGKKQTDKTKVDAACTEKVKPKQQPVCPHDPKLPPNDPKCKPPVKECKPGIPEGDERCNPPKECKPGIPEGDERCETCEDNPGKEGCVLPSTGPAGVAALFAGVTAAGTIGHRLFASYRNRR